MVKKRGNHLEGIKGWFLHFDLGIHRVSYIGMRISGLGLLVFLVFHVIHVSSILDGRVGWIEAQKIFFAPEWRFAMIFVVGLAIFHTVNGIRLFFNESGYGVGRPRTVKELAKRLTKENGRPRSLNKKNSLCIYASIGLAALFSLIGFELLGDF